MERYNSNSERHEIILSLTYFILLFLYSKKLQFNLVTVLEKMILWIYAIVPSQQELILK